MIRLQRQGAHWLPAGHIVACLLLAALLVLPGCGLRFPFTSEHPTRMTTAINQTPLIPRELLFGNPDRAAVRLSPDGRHLTFLAPLEDVLNIWIAPVDDPSAAEPITFDKQRGIRTYFWAFNNTHVVYTQDSDGDENWRIHAVDINTRESADLTPLEDVRAQIEAVSPHFPDEILIGLNDRNPSFHDVYRLNLLTGERDLLLQNDEFSGFVIDDQFEIRFAHRYNPDGSYLYQRHLSGGSWEDFLTVPNEDTFNTYIAGFNKERTAIFLAESRGRNTSALTVVDLENGGQTLLAEDPRADLAGIIRHPTERHVQAAAFNHLKREWTILDEDLRGDLEALAGVMEGEIELVSRTHADDLWVVAFTGDSVPLSYYLWDRGSREARFLFTNRTDLDGLPLVPMKPVVIPTRDGLEMVSYLTLPGHAAGQSREPLPMVLLVHGGPWSRDSWGYNPLHQFLANRGYAVLSVNFRGSTGFGKDFLNAGNREWGARMHDDLLDGVDWAVDQGYADPGRVAIMGGSYGGYATLVGLTFTPEVFACGVSTVGPSSLITLLESIPPYWEPARVMFRERVGDHTTEEGRTFLLERSPLTRVDEIRRPLLIGQGANDPRVKQAESDQIVEAMLERSIPVTYALYPDEGHGFARPENRLSFYAATEAFLARHLGGRYEAVGRALQGSSLQVPTGAGDVPWLTEALEAAQRGIQVEE